MLTILHDQDFADGRTVEVASAEGAFVTAPARATCKLAAALIEQGYAPNSPVRLVRADPWLYGPPYYISGVTLATVSRIDFFAGEESVQEVPSGRSRVPGDSSSTMS